MNKIQNKYIKKHIFKGYVIKKQFRTLIVKVQRRVKHPKYKKVLNIYSKYMVHNPKNKCYVGDMIFFSQSKPYSHRKRWLIISKKTI